MMNFDGKLPIVNNFWRFFSQTYACLRKICEKKDPCLENFEPKTPAINMLCTTPASHQHVMYRFGTTQLSTTFELESLYDSLRCRNKSNCIRRTTLDPAYGQIFARERQILENSFKVEGGYCPPVLLARTLIGSDP